MHVFRLPLLALLPVVLGSCSAVRLSYDNVQWLLARWAARYVDMDREQAKALKLRLGEFHAWHRQEELPRYAELLEQAAARLEPGLSRDDVVWALRAVRTRYSVLGQRSAGELAPLLMTLSAGQIAVLERRFAEDNRRFYAAKLPADPEKAFQARTDWLCERLEDWTGSLTPAQRRRVGELARAFPELPALRLQDRKRRQAELLQLLRSGEGDIAQLAAFLARPDSGRSRGYRETLSAWEQQFIDMLVDLDHSLSPSQRANAVQRFKRYAVEVRAMAADREPSVEEPTRKRLPPANQTRESTRILDALNSAAQR